MSKLNVFETVSQEELQENFGGMMMLYDPIYVGGGWTGYPSAHPIDGYPGINDGWDWRRKRP